jgi:hypothetical protein
MKIGVFVKEKTAKTSAMKPWKSREALKIT